MRSWALALLAGSSLFAACVDGKTPDCTSIDSGCFPEDAGSTPPQDASDASSTADVKPDAPSPTPDATAD
jgi:hypothetical protein